MHRLRRRVRPNKTLQPTAWASLPIAGSAGPRLNVGVDMADVVKWHIASRLCAPQSFTPDNGAVHSDGRWRLFAAVLLLISVGWLPPVFDPSRGFLFTRLERAAGAAAHNAIEGSQATLPPVGLHRS